MDGNRIKTLETTFELVELLNELNGAQIRDIATETGLAPSTIHRHLATLHDLGYVIQEDDTYHLSFKFVNLSETIRQRTVAFELAQSTVEELAERTGERAQFFVEEHMEAVYVCVETGEYGVMTDAHLGKTVPLHATGGGKAILAHLPESRVRAVLAEKGLPARTENTITDRDALADELETIRERGYSTNEEEYSKGSHAVGVPVFDEEDRVIGSLSVTGPTLRMRNERVDAELPNLLMGAANELSLNISYA